MTERTLDDFDDTVTIYKATGPPDHWITTLQASELGDHLQSVLAELV